MISIRCMVGTGPARRARPRAMETGFHRRVQPVRRGVPRTIHGRGHASFRGRADTVWDRRILGRLRSLALPTTGFVSRSAGTGEFGGPMVRFHVGLEDPADLIADLAAGFAAIGARAAP
jgi:hypothetical protein